MTKEGFAHLAFEAYYNADHGGEGGWEAWPQFDDDVERGKWLAVGALFDECVRRAEMDALRVDDSEPASGLKCTHPDCAGGHGATADGTTPGQAAYEAAVRVMLDGDTPDQPSFAWDAIGSLERASWEAAARAAFKAFIDAPPKIVLTDADRPQPAPELAATARAAQLTIDRDLARHDAATLRELTAEILDHFGPSGSGHTARVGQVQIAKWRTRAGLTR